MKVSNPECCLKRAGTAAACAARWAGTATTEAHSAQASPHQSSTPHSLGNRNVPIRLIFENWNEFTENALMRTEELLFNYKDNDSLMLGYLLII